MFLKRIAGIWETLLLLAKWYVTAQNNTLVTFTKFTELPQYKLSTCWMSRCSIFISFFFLWHCINVSKIPRNWQYRTIQTKSITFLKVKSWFADTVNYSQGNRYLVYHVCSQYVTYKLKKKNKKNNINKTGKTKKKNQSVPGNRHWANRVFTEAIPCYITATFSLILLAFHDSWYTCTG